MTDGAGETLGTGRVSALLAGLLSGFADQGTQAYLDFPPNQTRMAFPCVRFVSSMNSRWLTSMTWTMLSSWRGSGALSRSVDRTVLMTAGTCGSWRKLLRSSGVWNMLSPPRTTGHRTSGFVALYAAAACHAPGAHLSRDDCTFCIINSAALRLRSSVILEFDEAASS